MDMEGRNVIEVALFRMNIKLPCMSWRLQIKCELTFAIAILI